MRIAICDDEKSMGQILEEKVKKLLPDAVVEKYLSGDDLISSGFKPDILFMDIQMPKMDGYMTTREIRTLKNNKKANIPIVAMTANAFEEDIAMTQKVGMNGFIAKPLDAEKMFTILKQSIVGN